MAYITVLQLKTAVASIPAGANAWEIAVPEGAALTVFNNRTQDAQGNRFWTTKGDIHLDTLTWEAAP